MHTTKFKFGVDVLKRIFTLAFARMEDVKFYQ